MKKGRKGRVIAEASLTVTSMMDMFTILLIYLLYFFDPSNDPSQDLQLPNSSAQEAVVDQTALTVQSDGVMLGGRRIAGGDSADDLRLIYEALKEQRDKESLDNALLVVKCDKRVLYERLDQILKEAARAGYTDFRFVVLNESG
jgi:biopolymer transport protein ExbD